MQDLTPLLHPSRRDVAGVTIYPMESVISSGIRPLFWDVDADRIDLVRNSDFVISRILEWTTPAALDWLEAHYSASRILEVNRSSRRISRRSRDFWNLWYGAAP